MIGLAAAAVLASPWRGAWAQPTRMDGPAGVERPTVGAPRDAGPPGWSVGAYGELTANTRFYHPDPKQTGAYRHTEIDTKRLAFFIDNKISSWLFFSAEIELEHGGTGVTKEIEWEEFGEVETEVEKGGEIQLEQAYVEAALSKGMGLRAGRLLVPVGMTTTYHTPNMFSGVGRPESEAHMIPSIWHETGAELFARSRLFSARLQLATGLDSTGFSSAGWVSGGTQRRFETAAANEPGLAVGVDLTPLPRVMFGFGAYTSGTSKNRPKRDMEDVDARVVLGELHLRAQLGPLRLRGQAMAGTLSRADAITRRNNSLSNALGVPRTPVGSRAYAVWGEAALDVLAACGAPTRHRLDLFGRLEAYDTMWRAARGADNPLLERRVLAVGLNYFPHPRLVLKAERLRRWVNQGQSWGLRQDEINVAVGFLL